MVQACVNASTESVVIERKAPVTELGGETVRKRGCFENTEDYVRYLERRVELLELRVKKCRMDSDLFDSLRSVDERSNAFEMATLRKSRSGLPVNLYLDDSGSYLDGGHGPRIKFQPDKGNSPSTRSMIPMTISDEPTIPLRNYQSRLDGVGSNDISLIMLFVIANKANLLRLCDRNDEYDISNFLEDMVKVS